MDENDQVAWNLSQNLIIEIGNLLRGANRDYIEGRVGNAFIKMQTVVSTIIQDLKPIELEDIIKYERDNAEFMINYSTVFQGFAIDKGRLHTFNQGRFKYLNYRMKVMCALKKHGYTIPPKTDHTRVN